MSNTEKTLANFKRDTANHTMKVHLNNDLYRHIEFSKGGSSIYRFDLITWPGCLTIHGDCGTFTFERLSDMFNFFRMKEHHKGELFINPHYWQEKLQAGSCSSGAKAISEQFSLQKFKKEVGDWFNSRYPKGDKTTKTERQEVLQDIKTQILDAAEDEYSAVQAIRDFDSELIFFSDFWEVDYTEYKSNYLWCLYAIVWGISEFDKLTNAGESATPTAQ